MRREPRYPPTSTTAATAPVKAKSSPVKTQIGLMPDFGIRGSLSAVYAVEAGAVVVVRDDAGVDRLSPALVERGVIGAAATRCPVLGWLGALGTAA